MKLNCKIKLKENAQVIREDGKDKVVYNGITIDLDQTEQMILHHHENFELKEIVVILREFYQIGDNQANEFVEKFVEKISPAIDFVEGNTKFEWGNRVLFIQNPNIELIEDDDGTGILRDFSKGKMLFINRAGIVAWKYAEELHSMEEIMQNFATVYEVSQNVLLNDMKEFISSLVEKGYLIAKNEKADGEAEYACS